MKNLSHKGKFIVLEGLDGSGTSTQLDLLKIWLLEKEHEFGKTHFSQEPTNGPVGSLIRLALSKRLKALDERVMALLFAADRLDHLYCSGDFEQKEGINKMLEKGLNVLSDRYYLSSLAYQSLSVDLEWLKQINKYAIKPDLTIFLHIPVEKSLERRHSSRIHEELYENEKTLTAIAQKYEILIAELKTAGENIVTINGCLSKAAVFEEIKSVVSSIFS